jgi:hypothetical protein
LFSLFIIQHKIHSEYECAVVASKRKSNEPFVIRLWQIQKSIYVLRKFAAKQRNPGFWKEGGAEAYEECEGLKIPLEFENVGEEDSEADFLENPQDQFHFQSSCESWGDRYDSICTKFIQAEKLLINIITGILSSIPK